MGNCHPVSFFIYMIRLKQVDILEILKVILC